MPAELMIERPSLPGFCSFLPNMRNIMISISGRFAGRLVADCDFRRLDFGEKLVLLIPVIELFAPI